jgi:prefoldin subunit 5
MITLGSEKPNANNLDKFILEMLMQYEKNIAHLTNQLEKVTEKIECLTNELQKLTKNLAKAKKRFI